MASVVDIDLRDVGFSYGSVPLLKDVSLKVEAGSFHCLTGPSGAGKTTLMRLCNAEVTPQTGKLSIFGNDPSAIDRDDVALLRRRVGFVHQDCRFIDHLDLADNVALPLRVAAGRGDGLTADKRHDLGALLDWVGLSDKRSAKPPTLSGGERQRAALARAVIMAPDVILADEPTGNVDWEMAQRLLELLIELNQMGRAVVVATHDLALIRAAKAKVSARVHRLKGGALTTAGADL